MVNLMSNKFEPADLLEALTSDLQIEATGDRRLEIFIEVILMKSQKSIESFKILEEKFGDILRDQFSTEPHQIIIIRSLSYVWLRNKVRFLRMLDAFISANIIQIETALNFFSEKIQAGPDERAVKDVIRMITDKVIIRTGSFRTQILMIEKKLVEVAEDEERTAKGKVKLGEVKEALVGAEADEKEVLMRVFKLIEGDTV